MEKMDFEQTADGSYTLYVPELDEHYHSVKGALTESRHVFIEMGFKHTFTDDLRIFEVGFGTGLNAFLTLLEAEETKRNVCYTSIELYPLPSEVWSRLDYPALIGKGHDTDFSALHQAAWDEEVSVSRYFTLHKIHGDFTKQLPDGCLFDLIYFDAFAPEKQPEMWSQRLFDDLYLHLAPGGVLTTYCAKGVVRRMLQQSRF